MIELRNARHDGQEQLQFRTAIQAIDAHTGCPVDVWSDWKPVPAVIVPELLVNVPDGEPC